MRQTSGGTQSVRRALEMLRVVSEHNDGGLTLKELTQVTGLERSTAHRLISCLVEEGFAMRDALTRKYHVGMESLQVGLSAFAGDSATESLRPLVLRLARLSGDTVFLVMRQGDYALCLLREHGDFPVRIFTISEGEKRLMGIGAGGLALLSMLDDDAIEAVYARHKKGFDKAGCSLPVLLRKTNECRDKGYSETDSSITPGISGVGYAFSLSRITHVAISFGAMSSRLEEQRRQELGQMLIHECGAWLESTRG